MLVLLVGLVVDSVVAQTTQPAGGLAELVTQLIGRQAAMSAAGTPQAAPPVQPVAALEPGQVSVTDTGLLDVHVRDMELATLLETLSYQARANIVASTSVTGRVSANLYAVTLEQALEAVLVPNQYSFCPTNGTIFVGTIAEIAALGPPPTTRVFKLRYISPAEAVVGIGAVLGETAQVVEGGDSGASDSSGGGSDSIGEMGAAGVDYVLVTGYEADHAAVEQLLMQIDRRPRQVLIESTVMRATLNETNEFGVDFTMLGGVDFQNVGSTSNASANLSTGALPSADLQSTTFNLNTDFTANVADGGLTFGLIKDNVAAFIRALEETTDVVVVANPKIVALNKQEAEVIVGRRDGYLTTTVTETAAIQTVEFLETGTQIRFRPLINEDGTVRLSVHPKDSNGGLTAGSLPFEETTEAHADILVDDGETVLIGGLFRERTVVSKSQIPLLGDIPWAGELFGNRSDQTVREEVIILLTVHVIKETEEEREQYHNLLEDVERVRVGVRMGLLGTGRERLAQACFHEALRRLEQGDAERALLNVRMTLNNQPKHLPALKLKERLLQRRLWDDEGTRMRTFIWELIDRERAVDPSAPVSAYGRPFSTADAAFAIEPADDASTADGELTP